MGKTLFLLSLAGCIASAQTNSAPDFAKIKAGATNGVAQAQFDLAEMYFHGHGVTQNVAEAMLWYRRAAEKNFAPAQWLLGRIYDSGPAEFQDRAEAVRWYRKAAERGMPEALFNLGLISINGQGAPQDRLEAYKWFTLAAQQGSKMAQANRDTLVKALTPEQIGEGQRRAEVFLPKGAAPDK